MRVERREGLRIGVLLPSRETAMTGEHDAQGLVASARSAEQAGFDTVWAGDSPLARSRADPFTLLGAVAGATSEVGVGTAALIAALRHPLVVAHAAATVDQLSGGRLVLGLGAGFPVPETRHEFDAFGVPFDDRVRRLDESARLWRHVWSDAGRRDGFQSRYWQLPRGQSGLPAARPGGPPLWLASGDSAGVAARVAAAYDGWLPYLPSPERYQRAWTRIREAATKRGREVTPGLYATVHLDPDQHRAERELEAYVHAYYGRSLAEMRGIQAFFAGPADACAEWLASYLDAGATHLVLRMGAVPLRQQLERAAVDLLPALRRPMAGGR